jgi:hypothetical protein
MTAFGVILGDIHRTLLVIRRMARFFPKLLEAMELVKTAVDDSPRKMGNSFSYPVLQQIEESCVGNTVKSSSWQLDKQHGSCSTEPIDASSVKFHPYLGTLS